MRALILLFLLPLSIYAQEYQYKLDLNLVKEDMLKVTLDPPQLNSSELLFIMPKVIPGSYSRKDYGRFIQDFKAFDSKGNELKVKNKKRNDFIIYGAKDLASLEYWVEDTWDSNLKNTVFQPGGSNIEENLNFLINPHAFFGYFDGLRTADFTIEITKAENLEGFSALDKVSAGEVDRFFSKSYNELVDNPIMYSNPDTSFFKVGNTEILIAVYSKTGVVKSSQLQKYISPLCYALERFLGVLPVDRYVFLFYFEEAEKEIKGAKKGLGGYGALEHNRSSVYYLPEISYESYLKKQIRSICAHEFLHIVTPLNIHSEEIANFDFREPKMSKHLWFYEGITEYLSQKVQVYDSLIGPTEFLRDMIKKMQQASGYSKFSFTEMSEEVLKKKNQKRYLNVYYKGAIYGLILDIYLIHLSDGEYDLLSLLKDLSSKFGKEKAFEDEKFFDEIESLSYPHIKNFLVKYVEGDARIPYKYFLGLAGLDYNELGHQQIHYFGKIYLDHDEENDAFSLSTDGNNKLGIMDGDILLEVNGIAIDQTNAYDYYSQYFYENQKKEELVLRIRREDKEMELKAFPDVGYLMIRHNITEDPDASENEIRNRQILFYGSTF